MKIPNPYFEDVPCYGNLSMDEIIVDYVYPLLSVLKDCQGNRYLCMCFDTRGMQQWLITPISINDLIKLLRNKLTLCAPFQNNGTKKVYAVRDYKRKKDLFELVDAQEIPEENLPAQGEFLDADEGEWDEYILRIAEHSKYIPINTEKKRVFSLVVPAYTVYSRPRKDCGYSNRLKPNSVSKRMRECYAR